MKLLTLSLIIAIAIVELAVAKKLEVDKRTHMGDLKYKLHREPPIDAVQAELNKDEDVETLWMTQPLNQFDPQDTRTFQMRYMENKEYLQDGGPIFIFVGGEWTISPNTLRVGHLHDMAKELNGSLYYTEHRYYGQSIPDLFDDLSFENLRYLNIDQALADLAHFIVEIKKSDPRLANSGVIIAGCSYSATMVTWFMQKYPHLANGAWSSSAPLKAKVDFTEYKDTVANAIQKVGGEECARRIRAAVDQLEQWAEERNSVAIEESMLLCVPIDFDNKYDVQSLFFSFTGRWSGAVQYHSERYQDIQNECKILTESDTGNVVWDYANWYWHYYFSQNRFDVCYNHLFSNDVAYFGQTGLSSSAVRDEWRQWYYQTCAEYGWYQTSGENNTLFGSSFPVDASVKICEEAYSST